jgi:acyl carrier protein phosphodiesterase
MMPPELARTFHNLERIRVPRTDKARAALYSFILSKLPRQLANSITAYMQEEEWINGAQAYLYLQQVCADAESQHLVLRHFQDIIINHDESFQAFNNSFNNSYRYVESTGAGMSHAELVD